MEAAEAWLETDQAIPRPMEGTAEQQTEIMPARTAKDPDMVREAVCLPEEKAISTETLDTVAAPPIQAAAVAAVTMAVVAHTVPVAAAVDRPTFQIFLP